MKMTSILLLALGWVSASSEVLAQSMRASRAVQVRTGMVSAGTYGNTMSVGGAYERGVGPSLVASAALDYWRAAVAMPVSDRPEILTIQDLAFSLTARYAPDPLPDTSWRPFVVFGPTFHRTRIRADLAYDTAVDERPEGKRDASAFGFDLGGGFVWPVIVDFALSLETRYRFVMGRDWDQIHLIGGMTRSF